MNKHKSENEMFCRIYLSFNGQISGNFYWFYFTERLWSFVIDNTETDWKWNVFLLFVFDLVKLNCNCSS